MTRLERHQAKLEQFQRRYQDLLNTGQYIKAQLLGKDIRELEKAIQEARAYEEAMRPRPISELFTPQQLQQMGIIPLIVECHLVADFLCEVTYMIIDTCKEYGIDGISIFPDLKAILKNSEAFASRLATVSADLEDLITRNETFNASLHRKYLRYIEQRLKPAKTK